MVGDAVGFFCGFCCGFVRYVMRWISGDKKIFHEAGFFLFFPETGKIPLQCGGRQATLMRWDAGAYGHQVLCA